MERFLHRKSTNLIVIFALLFCISALGQVPKDSSHSAGSHFSVRAQAAIRGIETENKTKYIEETVSLGQQRTLDQIGREVQAAKLFMKSELDTTSIQQEREKASSSFLVVKEGVLMGNGEVQTHRNLTVSSAILTQLLRDMSQRKNQLDKLTQRLVAHRYKFDSLSTDSLLFTLSADSASIISYLKKLSVLNLSVKPADSLIDISIKNLQGMQAKLDPLVFELDLSLEGLEAEKQRLAKLIFSREFPNIWEPQTKQRPFLQILRFSIAKEFMAFEFYMANYLISFFILLAALLVCQTFLRSLRRRILEHPLSDGTRNDALLLVRQPFAVSVLIVLSLFQFIFIDPPFIISFFLWLISIVSLTVIFKGVITKYWMTFWITVSILFCLACLSNLLLLAFQMERWFMFVICLAGMCYGVYVLRGNRHKDLKEIYIIYGVRFMVAMETGALVFNIYGRYNLSKTLMICGYVGLIVAILFLWTVRLIDESLRVANSMYKSPDRKLFYVNFDKVGNKTPGFLYVMLFMGWFIAVGRNYYEFQQIIKPFSAYISQTRTIGDYEFAIRDLLLFIGISGSSVFLSRIVSFFASEPGIRASSVPGSQSSIAANWLLLIRILIITSGILLAFAASGIALDRLTIIIGALGVGIGLGLQNLVSNLVSGLIIAVERPVSVGDQVEVNGRLGTMKSVGFRSSIISLVDGACMIVPNGDLLSQHLINWTMGKDKRRLMITVGVAYGTNLVDVKQMLLDVLNTNGKIMSHPLPMVIANEFSASSIDLELIFWVRSLDESFTVRDEVLGEIDTLFRRNKIVIPVAQHDVYIKGGLDSKN